MTNVFWDIVKDEIIDHCKNENLNFKSIFIEISIITYIPAIIFSMSLKIMDDVRFYFFVNNKKS